MVNHTQRFAATRKWRFRSTSLSTKPNFDRSTKLDLSAEVAAQADLTTEPPLWVGIVMCFISFHSSIFVQPKKVVLQFHFCRFRKMPLLFSLKYYRKLTKS